MKILATYLCLSWSSLAVAEAVESPVALEDTYWRTTSIAGEPVNTVPQQIPHIAFHAADNRIAGFGGCNRFFATYSKHNSELSISIMGGGRASCPETDVVERAFLSGLQATTNFRIERNTLRLLAKDSALMEFVSVER